MIARRSGLINKIAATSAEVTDAEGLAHVCPTGGAVFGDKGYCVNPAKTTLKRKGCHDATIKPANMQGKETKLKSVGLQPCVHLMSVSLLTVTGGLVIAVCRRCNLSRHPCTDFQPQKSDDTGFEDIDRLGFEDINLIPAQGKY